MPFLQTPPEFSGPVSRGFFTLTLSVLAYRGDSVLSNTYHTSHTHSRKSLGPQKALTPLISTETVVGYLSGCLNIFLRNGIKRTSQPPTSMHMKFSELPESPIWPNPGPTSDRRGARGVSLRRGSERSQTAQRGFQGSRGARRWRDARRNVLGHRQTLTATGLVGPASRVRRVRRPGENRAGG